MYVNTNRVAHVPKSCNTAIQAGSSDRKRQCQVDPLGLENLTKPKEKRTTGTVGYGKGKRQSNEYANVPQPQVAAVNAEAQQTSMLVRLLAGLQFQ
jgi:hypothetical protein